MPIPPYPTVPAASTYVNGPVLTSELRSDVTNGVTFLANRPVFSANCTGTPNISAGTQALVLDTENFDSWAGHQPLGGSPQNYYCQSPGWYLAEGYVPWVYTGSTQFAFGASLGVNTVAGLNPSYGQQHYTNSGQTPGVFVADLVHLNRAGPAGSAGVDYVQLQASTTRGAPGVNVAGSSPNVPVLTARWVSAGTASSLGVPANASFPAPPTAVDATWLNTNIRDTVNFLTNPPVLQYSYVPGSNTLAVGTWPTATKLSLNTLGVDNFSGWSAANNQWTAPVAGVYYIYAQMGITASPGQPGTYAAGVTINGSTTWGDAIFANAAPGATVITSMTQRFRLSQGDVLSLAGFQGSSTGHALQPGTRLVVAWESS